ncbi:MAG: plastocyanin/azurin family copper-binding protein [Anaerolineae bacterium]
MKRDRLFKLGLIGALALAVFVAGLLSHPRSVLAQDMAHNTYMVQAGGFGEANVEILAFAPAYLKVHRGDTVMWHVTSFHNMRFGENAEDFIIVEDINGKPTPVGNPKVFFPTVPSGGSYTGGDANTGLPDVSALKGTYSLVMDVEPGVYAYRCDVHPGMAGIIEVVADDEAVPSPLEVATTADKELDDQMNAAVGAYFGAAATSPTQSTDGSVTISTGIGGAGRASSLQFASPLVFIKAGEKVIWQVPPDSPTAHFVNSVDYDPVAVPDIIPQENAGGPPTLLAGPGFLGTTPDGTTVGAGESFNSTFLVPGQSFSLTFKDPGVYPYICHVHPGMGGAVIVQ